MEEGQKTQWPKKTNNDLQITTQNCLHDVSNSIVDKILDWYIGIPPSQTVTAARM